MIIHIEINNMTRSKILHSHTTNEQVLICLRYLLTTRWNQILQTNHTNKL